MRIIEVKDQRDLNRFLALPYRLYKNDPMWVPPLRAEMRAQFNPNTNPFLKHCQYVLLLAVEDNTVVGRIAAFYDELANQFWGEPVGLFGYFECHQDPNTAEQLLISARNWLMKAGMKKMRGPWTFVTQEWGSVVEGFEPPPVIMSPYNPPVYNRFYEDFGLGKIKDLLIYEIDAQKGYQIPERIINLTDIIAKRYAVSTRALDMGNLDQEAENIILLSNQSLTENWGYSPVTDEEVNVMVADLKRIIQPQGVIFAEDQTGKLVGFAIAIPDINQLLRGLNGRLFPFGWIKLLRGIPKLTHYRMFALGVIPEYHGKGIDSLLYRALYESIFCPDMYLEINYVLEDNGPMNNAILKLGGVPSRRYRVFEMGI